MELLIADKLKMLLLRDLRSLVPQGCLKPNIVAVLAANFEENLAIRRQGM